MELEYPREQRERLLELAEQAIRDGARGSGPVLDVEHLPRWASSPRATFVTVYVSGQLNGCIGTLEARRSVATDIASNARSAAFSDPRFRAITAADLAHVTVHLAILGPLVLMDVPTEEALIEQMRVGVDGIVLAVGARRGTFLPAVWKKLPDPRMFLAHLKRKAGIPPDEWLTDLEVFRFEVEEFDRASLTL